MPLRGVGIGVSLRQYPCLGSRLSTLEMSLGSGFGRCSSSGIFTRLANGIQGSFKLFRVSTVVMSLGRQTPNANQGSRFGVFSRTLKRVAAKAANDMISKHCGVLVKCVLLPLSIKAPHDKDLAIYGASSKIGPPPEHVRSTRPRVCGGIVALDAVDRLGFQGFRV
jgi:hypothetical protein